MSKSGCAACGGTAETEPGVVCACVYRNVARACLERYWSYRHSSFLRGPISLDGTSSAKGRFMGKGLKQIEFMADFLLVAQRKLDAQQYRLFELFHVQGAPWKDCCRLLGLRDKGTVFHRVYALECKLGRAFLELQPYPLFPLAAYMSRTTQRVEPCAVPEPPRRYVPIRPPLAPEPKRQPAATAKAAPQPKPAPFDITDADSVTRFARAEFGAGRSPESIANALTRYGVPAPKGLPAWKQRHVKWLLTGGSLLPRWAA